MGKKYKQLVLDIENKSKNPYYFYNKEHALDEQKLENTIDTQKTLW